jgi:hypothetical protein
MAGPGGADPPGDSGPGGKLQVSVTELALRSNISTSRTSQGREVPIEQVLLPYATGGNVIPLSTT